MKGKARGTGRRKGKRAKRRGITRKRNAETLRHRLLDLLIARSYRQAASPIFRLASGTMSNFYIDCRATTMCGDAMPLIGAVFAEQLPKDLAAIGGLTMGADPIANAVAFYCATQGRRMNSFSIRKEAKQHGLAKWIEGNVPAGSKVAVIDDVVTTGGSTVQAIRRCREEGLVVAKVLLLVDRQEEGGIEAIRQEAGADVPVRAIFTKSDLEARAYSRSGS
jgi:orotate phosphoribosyltransferase